MALDLSFKCQPLKLDEAAALPLEGYMLNTDYYRANQNPMIITNEIILADLNQSGLKTVNEKILRDLTGQN